VTILRVEYWNPEAGYKDFSHISHERLMAAAEVIKRAVSKNLQSQIGKGKTTGINRPAYLTGDYAEQPWTAREAGQMLDSVRVVERKESGAEVIKLADNVRVYVGTFLAFYANIFEYYRPFMRPAMEETLNEVKQILGVE
jgi:uncharacterized protein (UPF0254 family)